MLLFTKKIHANRLRSGRKTIELRSGSRYQNVTVGDGLSINGRFSVEVVERFLFSTTQELQVFIEMNFNELGFNSAADADLGVTGCYVNTQPPFYAWRVRLIVQPEEKPALFTMFD